MQTSSKARIDLPFWIILMLGFATFTCLLLQVGCTSHKKNESTSSTIGTEMTTHDYNSLIDKNTRHDQQYDGFYNKFEVHVTFLNTEVQSALIQKKSETLKWSAKQAQTEREKLFQENSNQTKFAMTFFVPSSRLNDLHKGTSIWKVYLEAAGQRYEGKVTRRQGKLEDIQALYHYHNRWSTAYDVVFNVPLSGVETANDIKFILTSTQGTATLKF